MRTKGAGVPQMARKEEPRRLIWTEIEKLYVGKTFRRRKDGRQQTWRVVDCTIGGDLQIRWGRAYYARMIPQIEFLEWVKDAIEVKAP